jgi:hypothetical protein
MYRGSRLAASFLLFLTGSAVMAFGLGVLPGAIGPGGAWILVPIVVAAGIAHFVALAGVARGRAWGRELAVTIAEVGGGVAIAALFAVLLGADPFSATSSLPATTARANGIGLLVWMTAIYTLVGLSAGRIRFVGWRRRSAWWPAPLLRVGAA